VLFNQLAICDMAILQGLKSIKKLAKVIAFSSLISLLPTISIYYFFGENGIPWVIVTTAIISFITSRFFVNKVNLRTSRISFKKLTQSSRDILKPGIYLSLSSITALAIAYVVQIFITNYGSIEEVGLYNAGFAIIHSYVAVFFSALSKDFFPRLSEVSKNRTMVNKIVNEQAYMLLLLMTPIVIIFLVIKPFIVTLLYSKDFLPILGMITYGILATAFKSISWSMGFILIAKGDSRLYLITEVISNFLLLISIIIGYNIYGLTGLGVGYLVYHIIDFLFIKIIVSKKYNFHFNSNFNKLFYICTLQFIIITGLFYIEDEIIKNTSLVLLILFSLSFAIYRLNNHFSLIKLLFSKLKK
jgi:PST family polysaccharide transporter